MLLFVGWSDIEFMLRFSKTGTMLPIRYIFMSPIKKNPANLAARVAEFSLSKINRDLKNEYFLWKFANTSFYFNDNP